MSLELHMFYEDTAGSININSLFFSFSAVLHHQGLSRHLYRCLFEGSSNAEHACSLMNLWHSAGGRF